MGAPAAAVLEQVRQGRRWPGFEQQHRQSRGFELHERPLGMAQLADRQAHSSVRRGATVLLRRGVGRAGLAGQGGHQAHRLTASAQHGRQHQGRQVPQPRETRGAKPFSHRQQDALEGLQLLGPHGQQRQAEQGRRDQIAAQQLPDRLLERRVDGNGGEGLELPCPVRKPLLGGRPGRGAPSSQPVHPLARARLFKADPGFERAAEQRGRRRDAGLARPAGLLPGDPPVGRLRVEEHERIAAHQIGGRGERTGTGAAIGWVGDVVARGPALSQARRTAIRR